MSNNQLFQYLLDYEIKKYHETKRISAKSLLICDEKLAIQYIAKTYNYYPWDWTEITNYTSIATIMQYNWWSWNVKTMCERYDIYLRPNGISTSNAQSLSGLTIDVINFIMKRGYCLNSDIIKNICSHANITIGDVIANCCLFGQSSFYSYNPNLTITDIIKHRDIIFWKWTDVSRNSGIKMNDIFNTIKTIPWSFQNVLHNPNLSLRMLLHINPKHMDFNHKPLIFELIREYYENKQTFDDMTPIDLVLCNEYVVSVICRY
jgi:hypothetical protein